MSSTLGRMSLIVLLMKLFGNHVWRRRALWALFTLQMVANSIVTLTLYVQCPNIASQWNPAIISQCWSHNVELVSQRSSSPAGTCLTDVLVYRLCAHGIQCWDGLLLDRFTGIYALESSNEATRQVGVGILALPKSSVRVLGIFSVLTTNSLNQCLRCRHNEDGLSPRYWAPRRLFM